MSRTGKAMASAAASLMVSALFILGGATTASADSPWDRIGPHGATGVAAPMVARSGHVESPWD